MNCLHSKKKNTYAAGCVRNGKLSNLQVYCIFGIYLQEACWTQPAGFLLHGKLRSLYGKKTPGDTRYAPKKMAAAEAVLRSGEFARARFFLNGKLRKISKQNKRMNEIWRRTVSSVSFWILTLFHIQWTLVFSNLSDLQAIFHFSFYRYCWFPFRLPLSHLGYNSSIPHFCKDIPPVFLSRVLLVLLL